MTFSRRLGAPLCCSSSVTNGEISVGHEDTHCPRQRVTGKERENKDRFGLRDLEESMSKCLDIFGIMIEGFYDTMIP